MYPQLSSSAQTARAAWDDVLGAWAEHAWDCTVASCKRLERDTDCPAGSNLSAQEVLTHAAYMTARGVA